MGKTYKKFKCNLKVLSEIRLTLERYTESRFTFECFSHFYKTLKLKLTFLAFRKNLVLLENLQPSLRQTASFSCENCI